MNLRNNIQMIYLLSYSVELHGLVEPSVLVKQFYR